MTDRPSDDLSLDRVPSRFGNEEGYELWFDVPPTKGDATTPELQTLCRGAILLGWVAQRMDWDWPTLIRNVDHLSAPLDGFLVLEVGSSLLGSSRFQEVLREGVGACGLNASKIRIVDIDRADSYILAQGLPAAVVEGHGL